MKIKKNIYIFLIICFCTQVSFSKETQFDSSNIKILEKGNIINAYEAIANIPEERIKIEGDKAIYDKIEKILTFEKNVKFFDNKNNIYLEAEKVIYKQKENLIYTSGKTFVKIEDEYKVFSSNLYYDRSSLLMYGNEETLIRDINDNVFNLEDKFIYNIKEEIITSKTTSIIDNENNNYIFEDVIVNLKSKEIAGKEIKVDFRNSYFGNEKNDPVLKGRSATSDEKNTKIYKAVFSTCNIENKKCRGWELNSELFNHDKEKKVFEYNNSWLKIFNKKVFYFPFFSHPDPSVKRKTGFLVPSYTNSSNLGNSMNIPYYKVISVDKDLTFNPKLYADGKFILQNEYRQEFENSSLVTDFSLNVDKDGTNTHAFIKQEGKINKNIDFELNLQNVTNDNYLKIHNLSATSSLISNESLLTSNLNLIWDLDEDTDFNSSFKIYEDLSKNDNDRYQYIFPDFSFYKNIKIDEEYKGTFKFMSSGFQKNYDTNVYEATVNNDFLYESFDLISKKGLLSNYNILLKNVNSYSENSSNYNENNENDIYGTFLFKTSYPLRKKNKNSTNYLKPIFSARYSPNGNDNMSGKNTSLNFDNVFSLNRIGTNDQVESGKSLSIGLQFSKENLDNEKIIDINIANVIKDEKDPNLPTKTKLNETRSDIFGNMFIKPTKNLKLGYTFSYDRDLDYSNLDALSANFSTNNFLTNFYYYTENHDYGDSEVITNETELNFDNENSLAFKTSKDLATDFTQYYNLIYKYETDCLSATFEYNKTFFRDGSLKPDKSLSFLIRIIPFTEIRGSANTAVNR